MDWKLFILVIITAAQNTHSHPGVRTPPSELQEKFIKDTEITVETNETKITPLLTDGRYLNETPRASSTNRGKSNVTVDIVTNHSSMLVNPLAVSRINIFDEYQASSNFILNEFLRKNIYHLLNDGFGSRHLAESPGYVDNSTSFDLEENEKNETDPAELESLEKLVKEYYQINDQPTQNDQQNYGWVNDKVEYPTNDLLKQYYTQLYTSTLPQYGGFSTLSSPHTIAYIESTTQNPYFNSNKIPTTVLTDSNLSSIIVKKKKRKPPYVTSNYDPADPDPYYESEPDNVSPILPYLQPIGNTRFGLSTQRPNFPQQQTFQQNNQVFQQNCPGVNVVLNDQVSLNLRPEIGPCNNVKVNLNNEESEPPAPPKSQTSLFAETSSQTKRKRKRKRRPSKTKRRRKRPQSNFIEQPVTQAVPLVAHIPAIVAATSAPIPARRKPIKFKKKKLRKYKKWLKKFKGFGGIFLKVILFFTVANPIAFSFWTMLFSPLAVLIAGGAILAMVLYPLGGALLSSAANSHRHGYKHAIVIHKHHRPHKWRRSDDVDWGQWKRSDNRIPMYFTDRSDHSSMLDSIEEFLWRAIERFKGQV